MPHLTGVLPNVNPQHEHSVKTLTQEKTGTFVFIVHLTGVVQ